MSYPLKSLQRKMSVEWVEYLLPNTLSFETEEDQNTLHLDVKDDENIFYLTVFYNTENESDIEIHNKSRAIHEEFLLPKEQSTPDHIAFSIIFEYIKAKRAYAMSPAYWTDEENN